MTLRVGQADADTPAAEQEARWPEADTVVPPGADEVRVWRVRLDLPEAQVARLLETLSPDERARAHGYRFARDRRRFIAARGLLRALLGHCLGIAPSHVALTADQRGKTALAPDPRACNLRFNLAHTGDLALFALAQGREVGVDIERSCNDADWEAITAQFFAPAEIIALWSLPAAARARAFCRCRSRKEAYLKARGDGVPAGLDRFAVTLAPGAPARLLTPDGAPGDTGWSLRALCVGPQHCAAVAAAGRDWQLRCWQWPAALTGV